LLTAFADNKDEMEQVEQAVRKDTRRFSGELPIKVIAVDDAVPSQGKNN
jgi:hypothetical protein